MRRVIIIEADKEVSEVELMFSLHGGDLLLRGDAVLLGLEHDGSSMGIVGANVMNFMATGALKANPDVSLNVFNKMTQMYGAIGIGQCAGDKKAPLGSFLAHDSGNVVAGKWVIIPENRVKTGITACLYAAVLAGPVKGAGLA